MNVVGAARKTCATGYLACFEFWMQNVEKNMLLEAIALSWSISLIDLAIFYSASCVHFHHEIVWNNIRFQKHYPRTFGKWRTSPQRTQVSLWKNYLFRNVSTTKCSTKCSLQQCHPNSAWPKFMKEALNMSMRNMRLDQGKVNDKMAQPQNKHKARLERTQLF